MRCSVAVDGATLVEQRSQRDDDQRGRRQPGCGTRDRGRQPRSVPAASAMVNASTASTSEAKNAALTTGAVVAREIMQAA